MDEAVGEHLGYYEALALWRDTWKMDVKRYGESMMIQAIHVDCFHQGRDTGETEGEWKLGNLTILSTRRPLRSSFPSSGNGLG